MYIHVQCIVTRIILNCLLNYLIKEPRSSHLFWGRGVCIPASFSMHRSIPQIILAMRHHFILHFICCENDIKTYIFYRVFPLVSQVFWSIINHSWEYSVAFCFAFFSFPNNIIKHEKNCQFICDKEQTNKSPKPSTYKVGLYFYYSTYLATPMYRP